VSLNGVVDVILRYFTEIGTSPEMSRLRQLHHGGWISGYRASLHTRCKDDTMR